MEFTITMKLNMKQEDILIDQLRGLGYEYIRSEPVKVEGEIFTIIKFFTPDESLDDIIDVKENPSGYLGFSEIEPK